MEVEITFEDEYPETTLAQIRAAKSFFGHESFATFLKSLSGDQTLASLSRTKFAVRPYLEHSNLPLQTSNILQESGTETEQMSDYLEYPLPESWIMD